MSGHKLPAVRLPPALGERECMVQDAVLMDLPPSNKFGFTWPSDPVPHVPTPPSSERPALSSSEGETDTSEGESNYFINRGETDQFEDSNATPTHRAKNQPPVAEFPTHPRFSRALSMPLPSQLGHLQNPHRQSPITNENHSEPLSPQFSQFRELSLELADSVQMVIQTMLQISPPQVLDPAKEQFSACSLSVPTPSMSAMFTTMKNLNYISANMAAFCVEPSKHSVGTDSMEPPEVAANPHNDFDIGEMLQSVGDALGGAAAQAGVDLVLFHGDVGLKHVSVRGDENGMSYTLSHVIRQVLSTAHRGDSIELGLFVGAMPPKRREASTSSESEAPVGSDDDFPLSSSPVELEGPLQCTIDIAHKFGVPDSLLPDGDLSTPATFSRVEPTFSTLLLRRLLRQVGATLVPDLPPRSHATGRSCQLSLVLERGSPSPISTPATLAGEAMYDDRIATEPTLEQLTIFAESLRGKRVTLYASSKGSFAHHLTSYLTAWGMDVSHISAETGGEGAQADASSSPMATADSRLTAGNPLLSTYGMGAENFAPTGIPPKVEARQSNPQPLSFIFIDDDVAVLKERLQALRIEQPYQLNLNLRKRPSLAAHHRPRSSPQVARALGQNTSSALPTSSVVVVHFTSLANYKLIKDVIQSVLASYSGSSAPLPEVLIIPKPAGPRRFLTALHTAVTKPVVDPFFAPIATSPSSPSLHVDNSFFNNVSTNSPRSPVKNRPSGSRSNSDRSTKSTKDIIEQASHAPASPLGMSDSMEYFSETAVKLGTSPSSGLVIQSPDGQPAGIFFHPRAKSHRNVSSSLTMERDKGHLFVPPDRRGSTSRRPSDGDTTSAQKVSFSSLHEVGSSPQPPQLTSEAPSSSSSSIPKLKTKKSTSPRSEEFASLQPSSLAISRRPASTEMTRQASSPPGSPSTESNASPTTRRAVARRPTPDSKATTPPGAGSKKGKSIADANIVPPISVLIVDDNPINQTILSTFMKKKKIKYDVAKNGQEAVQKWRTGGFHLILMDIQMPVMDGIQATKEIRRLEKSNASAGYPPTPQNEERTPPLRTPSDASTEARSSPYRSSVIIVALTASSLQTDRVAALAAGCNDFLTKPVSLLWLNNKIIEWGSIKALQMWADLRPDVVKTISTGQAVQARNVADRLHVPKGRNTPSPSRTSTMPSETPPSTGMPPMTGVPPNSAMPVSTTSSAFWSPGAPSPPNFWGGIGQPSPPANISSLLGSPIIPPNYPPPKLLSPPTPDSSQEADDATKPSYEEHDVTDPATDPPAQIPGETTGEATRSSDDDAKTRTVAGEADEPLRGPSVDEVAQPSQ